MITLHIHIPRPRNPFVAAARVRKAGTHQLSAKRRRLSDRRNLQRELSRAADLHSP